MSEKDYEKERKKLLDSLKSVEKETDSKVVKKVIKGEEREYDEKCKLAEMIFRESLDMYEMGDLSWKEMVDDLSATLMAIEAE